MQVEEVEQYMHGLTQIHLHRKRVATVFKVKITEDILYNEAKTKYTFHERRS